MTLIYINYYYLFSTSNERLLICTKEWKSRFEFPSWKNRVDVEKRTVCWESFRVSQCVFGCCFGEFGVWVAWALCGYHEITRETKSATNRHPPSNRTQRRPSLTVLAELYSDTIVQKEAKKSKKVIKKLIKMIFIGEKGNW